MKIAILEFNEYHHDHIASAFHQLRNLYHNIDVYSNIPKLYQSTLISNWNKIEDFKPDEYDGFLITTYHKDIPLNLKGPVVVFDHFKKRPSLPSNYHIVDVSAKDNEYLPIFPFIGCWNKRHEYVAPGTISNGRRDYEELKTIRESVTVIGNYSDRNITFNNNVILIASPDSHAYYKIVAMHRFLLTLHSKNQEYYNFRTSSSVLMAFGMLSVPLMNERLADIYDCHNCSIVGETLAECIDKSKNCNYDRLSYNILTKRDSIIIKNDEVLKQFFP